MPPDDALKAQIKANVARASRQFAELTDAPFPLDRSSIAWLEGYIERMRKRDPNLAGGGLASVIACFLGEAIITAVPSAAWDVTEDHGLGVQFTNGDTCYPVAKVDKQFKGGLEDGESILSFYDIAVNYVATGKLGQPDPSTDGTTPSPPRQIGQRLRRWWLGRDT